MHGKMEGIVRPVHGLIFLFKWRPGDEPAGELVTDERLHKIFFAKQVWRQCAIASRCINMIESHCLQLQVIQNACATQAIVNLLLNVPDGGDMKLGEILSEFKRFTSGFDEAVSLLFSP